MKVHDEKWPGVLSIVREHGGFVDFDSFRGTTGVSGEIFVERCLRRYEPGDSSRGQCLDGGMSPPVRFKTGIIPPLYPGGSLGWLPGNAVETLPPPKRSPVTRKIRIKIQRL